MEGDGPDAPTQFADQGMPPARDLFDEGKVAEELGLWWKSGGGTNFAMGSEATGFAVWPETALVDLMRSRYGIAIKAREDERLSESKRVFLWARMNRCVDEFFNALAGYTRGMHVLPSGERVLVKTEPRVIEPVKGDWENVRAVIEGLLGGQPGEDQVVYFHAWCRVAYLALRDGRPGQRRPGHGLIIASPGGSGKSFLQNHIITPILGGREADPLEMLFGKDNYNGDCAGAEHLCLAEVPSSQRTIDRIALAETIKQVVANPLHRLRLMRTDPWPAYPFWRLSITLNDEPDKLRSLPAITGDYGDKVLIFHGRKTPMPMPTGTDAERRAFADQIAAEIPAYLHWLTQEWEIPEELLTYQDGRDATRFGFREYHSPIIRDGLFDETPAGELMTLIDMAEIDFEDMRGKKVWELPSFKDGKAGDPGRVWHGPAHALEAMLKGEKGYTCSVDSQVRDLLRHNNLSRLLSRLESNPDVGGKRVAKADCRAWKGWLIGAPSK